MRFVPKSFVMVLVVLVLALACGPASQPAQQEQPRPQDQAKPADQAMPAGQASMNPLEERLANAKKLVSMSNSDLRKVTADDLLKMFPATWGCEGTPRRGGTLKRATSADFPHMDPTYLTIDGFMQHGNAVYSRLVQKDATCDSFQEAKPRIAADLAKSWEFSPDGKRLTFRLVEGVKWQNLPPLNGRDFTSDDVKWTVEHYKTAEGSVHKATLDVIERVETPDKNTAVFVLKQPAWYLMDRLTGFRQNVILPKDIKERDGDFRRTMVGTGPFMLKELKENVSMTFERNPDFEKRGGWFAGKPYLDRMEIFFIKDEAQQVAAYRSGQVHYVRNGSFNVLADAMSLLKTRPDSIMVATAPTAGSRLGIRLDQKPFDDVRVRRALSMAVDRGALIDQIFDGRGMTMHHIPWTLVSDRPIADKDLGPYNQYNLAEAKKLMAEAGYANGFAIDITFFRYSSAIPDALAIFKQNWKELGVTLSIQEQDYSVYNNLLAKADYKQMTWAWGPSSDDGDVHFYETYHSKSVNNRYRTNDPKADALSEKIRAEMDDEKRKALMKEFWDYSLDQTWTILYPGGMSYRLWDQKLRGFRGGGNANRVLSLDHAAQVENMWLAE